MALLHNQAYPILLSSFHDSHSPRVLEKHRIIGSAQTTLSRTAPHNSPWTFRQSSELIRFFIKCSQSSGHMIQFLILIINYLCSIHYSLGTTLYLQLIGNGQVGQYKWIGHIQGLWFLSSVAKFQ